MPTRPSKKYLKLTRAVNAIGSALNERRAGPVAPATIALMNDIIVLARQVFARQAGLPLPRPFAPGETVTTADLLLAHNLLAAACRYGG